MGLNMGKIIQHSNVRITHKGETTLMKQKKNKKQLLIFKMKTSF